MESSKRPMSRGTFLMVALVATVVVIACLAVFVFPMFRSPAQMAADAAPPSPSPITAKAEKRALSAKIVLRAAVIPGSTVDLKPSDALGAAGMVVTSIPAASAATVESGTVLVEANGEPLIAMNWPFPAYRDIRADDAGPDVVQVQKTLAELGYTAGSTGVFDDLTRAGVKALYADRGYAAPTQTGAVGAGAATGGGKAQTGSAAGGDANSSRKQESSGSAAGSNEVYLPARDVLVIPVHSSRLTGIPVKVGQKLAQDTVIAQLDGKASTVLASTTPDRAARLVPGADGTLTAATGQTYQVKVSSIAASAAEVPGLGQGVRVDLEFADPAKAPPITANGTTLRLEVATGIAAEGLVLPITAIYSAPDGSTYVIPAGDPGRNVAVAIGATVDGWVEIKPGPDVTEGAAFVLGTQRTG